MTDEDRIAARLAALGARDVRPDMKACWWTLSAAPCAASDMDISFDVLSGRWVIACLGCGTGSNAHDDIEDALAEWNSMQSREVRA